jgi:FAD binding domain
MEEKTTVRLRAPVPSGYGLVLAQLFRYHEDIRLTGGQVVGEIRIPSTEEILNLSWPRCQQERIRLKNEISFARGDEIIGGPSSADRVAALNFAIELIEERLRLADRHKVPALNLWVKGEPVARLPFETIGEGLTAYPFLEIFPQDQHERLLIERLEKFGVSVERRTELMHFTDEGGRVTARLGGLDGREEDCQVHYIAGCDGAGSIVREILGTGYPGGTYRQIFYVADVEAAGPTVTPTLTKPISWPFFLWPAKAGFV